MVVGNSQDAPKSDGNTGTQYLAALQLALRQAGAHWQAGVTSVSELSDEDKKSRLGANPTSDQVVQASIAAATAAVEAVGFPASYDLRNVNSQNFITPIKDQGGCGSCVAFGTTATVEGTFRVQRGNAGLAVDLSEAQVFYCYGRSAGAMCGTGWWPDAALDGYKNGGVADDACYPYTAGDQNCTNLCADWQSRATKITGWHTLTDPAAMKTWLSTRGPLSSCFIVYNDFFAYRSGVYHHVTGNEAGGHCISVVGYDDAGQFWICKNSWGTGWGESGFFCIAYSDLKWPVNNVPTTLMWAVEGIVETGWLSNKRIQGLWANDQDRNAYAYVQDLGWRRIAADNDNIFFDLLGQLATAKSAGRPVNVYQDSGVIKEIYVL